MLGAIIGDIVGSRFEFNNHRNKDFDLFAKGCFATDDSVMTLAVAKAIMETEKSIEPPIGGYGSNGDYLQLLANQTVKYMQEIGRKYPDCGYGGMFARWVFSDNPEPYNSFGNGAAMRISSAGFAARSESEAVSLSETITSVTHNHKEGIKGAEATAVAIYMARRGLLKSEIRDRISKEYYPLDFTIDEIRPTYTFNETCQETVPQAIAAFLESKSFEDAIRIAISLGGDSDTIAAITGAIAEAYYGVPNDFRDKALRYLDDELRAIYDEWEAFIGKDGSRFNVLTKYIGRLSPTVSTVSDYIHEPPYETLFHEFYDEFMHFIEANDPQYCEDGIFYTYILRDKNFSEAEVAKGNVDDLDALTVLAIIHRELISGSHWNYKEIDSFKEEKFVKWLKRLKDIDWQATPKKLSEILFEIGGYGGYDIYHLLFTDNRAFLFSGKFLPETQAQKRYSVRETEQLIADWNSIHTEYWKPEYPQEGDMIICDGTQWSLFVRYEGSRGLMYGGDNTYPENWEALLALFGLEYDDGDDEDDDYDDGEKPGRKPGEVIYCSVSFSDNGSTYYYQTEDESIKVGDRVIVPVGANNDERVAIVEEVKYFTPETVPFPKEKTKAILRKQKDEEGKAD